MNITVVGLDKEGVYLDDIRVEIPYQVAVSIPAQFMNSRELGSALNQRRLFRLQGSLPPGAVFRGTGAVPRSGAPAPSRRQQPESSVVDVETQGLKAENASLKQELAEQKALNTGLQATLSAMSGQLTAIQGILEALRTQGFQVLAVPGGTVVQAPGTEDDAPMFIPSVKRDDIKANITVQGSESEADIGGQRNALKALRQQKKKS